MFSFPCGTPQARQMGSSLPITTPPVDQFHPDPMEFRLDDNYATRMIAGGLAHEHDIPLPRKFLGVAATHMVTDCCIADESCHFA